MYHVIINPASKSGRGKNVWQELEPVLQEQGAAYTVHFTKQAGDAKRFAEELTGRCAGENAGQPQQNTASGEKISLLVMGGDGTLNEVLQGISDFERTALYYVPLGSGNDFARDYKEKGTPAERLRHLLEAPAEYYSDLGVAQYQTEDGSRHTHYFAVSTGIGYDAAVCAEVNRSKLKPVLNRIGLGKLVYLAVALRQLFRIPKTACGIWLEDGTKILQKGLLLSAVMNHRYEGGGFMFAPKADAVDGVLDLCLVEDMPILKILRVLPTVFHGKHVKYKEVHMYRGGTIRIKVDQPMDIHFDGEVPGKASEVIVSCRKQALHFYL